MDKKITKNDASKIQAYINKMPSLPQTVTKVLSICDNPNTSPMDLHRVISLDPVLTGQVLKLINSAYFFLPSQVVSLTQAVIMLGINTVKNLALSTAVIKSAGGRNSFKTLPMNDFWTHSIGVGVTAKLIAKSIGVPSSELEEYFVAGLLHDLGKIPLNDQFSEAYAHALTLTIEKNVPLFMAEKLILGFDHLAVGRLIAEKWKLSDTLKTVMSFHHMVPENNKENGKIARVIYLADCYVNLNGIGSAGNVRDDVEYPVETAASLKVSLQELDDLKSDVYDEIKNAKIFLQISA